MLFKTYLTMAEEIVILPDSKQKVIDSFNLFIDLSLEIHPIMASGNFNLGCEKTKELQRTVLLFHDVKTKALATKVHALVLELLLDSNNQKHINELVSLCDDIRLKEAKSKALALSSSLSRHLTENPYSKEKAKN
jgi:hypothetical protein